MIKKGEMDNVKFEATQTAINGAHVDRMFDEISL